MNTDQPKIKVNICYARLIVGNHFPLLLTFVFINFLTILSSIPPITLDTQQQNSVTVQLKMQPEIPIVGESVTIRYVVIDKATHENLLHVESNFMIINDEGYLVFASPIMHSHEGEFSLVYRFNESGRFMIIIEAKSTPELALLGGKEFGIVRFANIIEVVETGIRATNAQIHKVTGLRTTNHLMQLVLHNSISLGAFSTALILYMFLFRNHPIRKLLGISLVGFMAPVIASVLVILFDSNIAGLIIWISFFAVGTFLIVIGLRRIFNVAVAVGLSTAITIFFLEIFLIYYVSGIYKYAEMLYTFSWLIKYFAPYLSAFAITTGASLGMIFYSQRLGIKLTPTIKITSLGAIASFLAQFYSFAALLWWHT